jgi:hypothetical protein
MPTQRIYNIPGVNVYVNPVAKKDNEPIYSVNMVSEPYGAKTKRSGYITYLGTANGSAVTDLFSWTKNDGSLFVYRNSGGRLYHSIEGTGAWTISGNGTVTAGNHVGYAVLNDTLIVGDGAGSTRHSTNGTSFTDTTLAPVGQYFEEYQRRIYIGGTASTLFYSTSNNAADWVTSGTSDSSSFTIPGAGKMGRIFKCADRLVATKTSGIMQRWDGYSLVDMCTSQGPSSPYSVSSKEGYYFYLNRDGVNGYGGDRPKLISNPIQSQIYNNLGSAIVGTDFDTLPATTHRYDYLLSAGTITDSFTRNTISNAVIKYDYLKNEFLNYSLYNNPTAWHSYKDASGNQQLIFGDASGQCYKFAGTATSDNSNPISCHLEFVIDMDSPDEDKFWRWITISTNPGCQAKCQVAFEDTYRRDSKKWVEIGDLSDGVTSFRFPTDNNARSKMLFIRFYESSKDYPFTLYGFSVDADVETRK